jgi:hypothetical protein
VLGEKPTWLEARLGVEGRWKDDLQHTTSESEYEDARKFIFQYVGC